MRFVFQEQMPSFFALGLALGLSLGAPMAAGAESPNPAVDRAMERLASRTSDGRPRIEPRPRFAYLLGDADSARLLTSEDGEGLPIDGSRDEPSVLLEIQPAGKECIPPRGACPVPFPINPSPPPPPLPFVPDRLEGRGDLADLTVHRMAGDRLRLAATGDAPFLVVAGGQVHHLVPGAEKIIAPPLEVYRLLAVGRFAPDFRPAASDTAFDLMPCPNRPWTRGLCTRQQATALLRSPR